MSVRVQDLPVQVQRSPQTQARRSLRLTGLIRPLSLVSVSAIASLMTACNVSQPPTSSATNTGGVLPLAPDAAAPAAPAATATPSDPVYTYTVGALEITGDRTHVCNVLLPRGPGIGGDFFYPEEANLWASLNCPELYCNLADGVCRDSLKSVWADPDGPGTVKAPAAPVAANGAPVLREGQESAPMNEEPMPVVDRVLQYPSAPLPVQVFEVVSLTADQVNGLNGMYQRFAKVDARTEPIAPGSATVHNEWAALCLGEENQAGCPKSAAHQLISYGEFWRANQFVTSGGWVLYKP